MTPSYRFPVCWSLATTRLGTPQFRQPRSREYVVDVSEGGIELANCYSPWRRDTHIHLALRPDAPQREQVVLEISATIRDWAERQGRGWSTETLKRELVGHWCYFEGWMFFDSAHAHESDNTAPGRSGNWRATAWELHPVTYLEIKKANSEPRPLFPGPPKTTPTTPE